MSNVSLPLWISVLQGLLTPTIALLGAYIGWQQWRTNRNKLKLDLFERRYTMYDAAVQLINSILRSGKATQEAIFEFTSKTRSANFIVGKGIAIYLDGELRARAIDLETLQVELSSLQGPERVDNLKKQSDLKRWFAEQYDVLQQRFKSQLNLRH